MLIERSLKDVTKGRLNHFESKNDLIPFDWCKKYCSKVFADSAKYA